MAQRETLRAVGKPGEVDSAADVGVQRFSSSALRHKLPRAVSGLVLVVIIRKSNERAKGHTSSENKERYKRDTKNDDVTGKERACKTSGKKRSSRVVRARNLCLCGKCRPSFGEAGGSAVCCKQCKTSDMVDVAHKRCLCGKAACSYGEPGGKAVCCKHCKTLEMVNVVTKRCFCGKGLAVLGEAGGKAVYCKVCKTPEMVNTRKRGISGASAARPNRTLGSRMAKPCVASSAGHQKWWMCIQKLTKGTRATPTQKSTLGTKATPRTVIASVNEGQGTGMR